MKSQETLSKIMELLNLQDEVKLESMKLENGTTIEAEAFEPNQEVFIVTEDERIALPVGEYELEDGRILVVAEEGVIAEMRDAAAEEEAPEEAPAEEPTEEVEANEEEEKEMSYATKEELSAAVAEMKEMIEEIKAMMSPKEEEMAEEVVKKKLRKNLKRNFLLTYLLLNLSSTTQRQRLLTCRSSLKAQEKTPYQESLTN